MRYIRRTPFSYIAFKYSQYLSFISHFSLIVPLAPVLAQGGGVFLTERIDVLFSAMHVWLNFWPLSVFVEGLTRRRWSAVWFCPVEPVSWLDWWLFEDSLGVADEDLWPDWPSCALYPVEDELWLVDWTSSPLDMGFWFEFWRFLRCCCCCRFKRNSRRGSFT